MQTFQLLEWGLQEWNKANPSNTVLSVVEDANYGQDKLNPFALAFNHLAIFWCLIEFSQVSPYQERQQGGSSCDVGMALPSLENLYIYHMIYLFLMRWIVVNQTARVYSVISSQGLQNLWGQE